MRLAAWLALLFVIGVALDVDALAVLVGVALGIIVRAFIEPFIARDEDR